MQFDDFAQYLLCDSRFTTCRGHGCVHFSTHTEATPREPDSVSRYGDALNIYSFTAHFDCPSLVQSSAIVLLYNLPDKVSIRAMNWTYVTGEFEFPKLVQLQKLVIDFSLSRRTRIRMLPLFLFRL